MVVWRSKNKDTEKKKPTKVGLGRQPDSVMMVILFIMLRAIHVIVPASTGPSTTGRRHLLNSSDDLPVGGFPKWSRSNEVTNQLRILEQPTRNIRYNLPENKEQQQAALGPFSVPCIPGGCFFFFLRCRRPSPIRGVHDAGDASSSPHPPIYGVCTPY